MAMSQLRSLIHNMVGQHKGVSIFCGIGERSREGEELYRYMCPYAQIPGVSSVALMEIANRAD